jgi:hypothetical protein
MDDSSQAALEVAHRTRADPGSLSQPFLSQPGRPAQALESRAQLLVNQIGDLNGEQVSWCGEQPVTIISLDPGGNTIHPTVRRSSSDEP